jgi:hypothetical protein
MQHLNLFYIFSTLVVGIVSFGIGVVDYIKTRETLVRYYLYFHLSLSLMVLSDLGLAYISANFPDLPAYVPGGLNYIRVFIVDSAMMITFPVLIHEFFMVPYARQRNLFFGGLAALLCLGEHLFTFVYPMEFFSPIESVGIIWDDIEDLIQVLIFFYGFVLGISMFGQLRNQRRKRLAKSIMILLGISMPAIMIDTLKVRG